MTKKRFIRWLKVFIEMMIDASLRCSSSSLKVRFLTWSNSPFFALQPQFNAMTASRHTRALLLSTLDLFPDWVQVSTEAARQTDKNEGPYAVLGLSWDDLKKYVKVRFLEVVNILTKYIVVLDCTGLWYRPAYTLLAVLDSNRLLLLPWLHHHYQYWEVSNKRRLRMT